MKLRIGQQPVTNPIINPKSNILLAGPWVGELGWELFCWQGYVRRLSKSYQKTIVLSRTGHKFLYDDFVDEYIPFNAPASKANMWLGEVNQNELNSILKRVGRVQHVNAFNIGFAAGHNTTQIIGGDFNAQDFIKYNSNTLDKSVDIIVHPRNKIVGSNRNWSKDSWQKLVDLLLKDYSIGVIGTDEAFYLDGTEDLRNISIEDTISIMNRTKLVLGQSSGPLHLASLSGTPHFVWSGIENKERYETQWNPFGTKVYFYYEEGWSPNVNSLYLKIKENLI